MSALPIPELTSKDTRVEFDEWQVRTADLATFEALRCEPYAALRRAPPAAARLGTILERIRGNAEQIATIYRDIGPASPGDGDPRSRVGNATVHRDRLAV